MVGIDIVKIERFEKRIHNRSFIKRILGEHELAEFDNFESDQLKVNYLAKIFSVKEACFKATQTTKNFHDYNLIKVNNVPKILEESSWNISISHDAGYVIAVCVVHDSEINLTKYLENLDLDNC